MIWKHVQKLKNVLKKAVPSMDHFFFYFKIIVIIISQKKADSRVTSVFRLHVRHVQRAIPQT